MSVSETTKASIPDNANASLNAVANTWEKFVGTGELNDKHLRPVIANSWLRCRDLGINPLINRARSVISEEEIEAKLHNENLGISGKNVLDRMSNTVKETGHVIVLADNSGRILYSVGHKGIQGHLEKINFKPGSEWNEENVGPNGIGTALSLGQPELVMGSEHFCKGWQPWVCYGAPIHNPSDRSVLGCIDITGPANKVCVEAMALAISITQSIESDLSVIHLKKREKLRLAFRDLQLKWPNDAALIVDEHGYIVDINSYANDLLNHSVCMMNQSIDMYLPDLRVHMNSFLDNETEKEIEIENSFMGNTRFLLKPIRINRESLGCFIMIIDRNYGIRHFSSLRSNEDELIRKTLIQTNGNISKAARILDIDRATIYRRRKNWQ
jgi:transcriptional regulator of acetoin/glycerol metabolism